jgi:hypothetical protein
MRAYGRIGIIVAAVVCAAALLEGCPPQLTTAMFTQATDTIAPTVTIDSPAEGSLCANVVEVTGTAVDSATKGRDDGRVRSLSYAVAGSVVSGTAEVAEDGSFDFQFSTTTLGTNFTLVVTAVDWNGNPTQAMRPLCRQSGNGIPSFTAAPGNQKVTLTWSPVPHAARYDLRYTTNGSLPSEGIGRAVKNVTSPFVVSGLANGSMHVFQLDAVPEADWPESLSDYVKAIPLSAQTLAPQVTGGIRKISMSWSAIAATKEFEVWRSTDRDGTYRNLSGPIQATSFTDQDVENGQWYWYEVRPTMSGSSLSGPNGAQPDPFCVLDPVPLGSVPMTNAQGVAIRGSYAYVADGGSGLRIVDISDPSSLRIVGTGTASFATAVAVSGNYAYVEDFGTGLRVFNVSTPVSPTLTGTCTDVKNAVCLAASGTTVFTGASRGGGMIVIDASNPAMPVKRGTHGSISPQGIALVGSTAYVAAGAAGLLVFDVSDLDNPSVLATCAPSGINAGDVCVRGTRAYVADHECGLRIIDITNPALPVSEGATPNAISASQVAVSGPYAFLVDDAMGLRVVDITDPAAPVVKATHTMQGLLGLATAGGTGFLAAGSAGFQAVDVSYPSIGAPIGTCTESLANRLVVNGSYAYLARNDGLRVVDVSSPAVPVERGSWTSTDATWIAVSGTCAAVTSLSIGWGLLILDLSSARAPALQGTFPMTNPRAVAVNGPCAYVADDTYGLYVVDISTPTAPVLKGICGTSKATAVAVQGSFAYVADGTSGLRVVDVSSPSSPTIKGTCPTTDANRVAVSGSTAFIANSASGIDVIDVSDPGHPTLRHSIATAGPVYDIAAAGSFLYAAEAASGIEIYDVSDAGSPSLIASSAIAANALAVIGSNASISTDSNMFMVLDLLP